LNQAQRRLVVANDEGRFALKFPYDFDLKEEVKRFFRWKRWNDADKIWEMGTQSVDLDQIQEFARKYEFAFTEKAKWFLENRGGWLEARERASHAASSDFEVLGLGGDLRPFQRAGVEYIVRHAQGKAYLADEMGLGKTIEALAVLQAYEAFPALIVCPASLKYNWELETQRWLRERGVYIVDAKHRWVESADVVIVNYDLLWRIKELTYRNWKAIVFDESHALKNPKTKRTMAALEIASRAPIRLALSGTPVLNRPHELVSQLEIIGRINDFGGKWAFLNRYCKAWDGSFRGANNIEELNEKLRQICYIRRLKVDVLSELPAKQRTPIPLSINNRSEYDEAEANFLEWLAMREGGDAAAKAMNAEAITRIEKLKQLAAHGKLQAVIAWIEEFLETGSKLVIFAHHLKIIDAIADNFSRALTLKGEDSPEERQAAVEAFQEDPERRLFVASLTAGGLGITLTAASNVAFVELGWTPAVHNQAEDRLHRIGQKDSVNCWYLIAKDTIEERILTMIEEKRMIVDAATQGGLPDPSGSFIGELLLELRSQVPGRDTEGVLADSSRSLSPKASQAPGPIHLENEDVTEEWDGPFPQVGRDG
jgi:SWI/SNF-related matrix-associated actin-dependent regulator of chromatin subfamily A-like protein 1